VAEWFRRCAISRMGLGSISGGVTGFFSDIFPSDCTMALWSTQPLVKMSTRDIPGGKGGRCVRLTTSPPYVLNIMKSGSLNLLEPSGSHRACYGTPLPLITEQTVRNLAWTWDNQTPQFIYSSRWCKHVGCEKLWAGSDSRGNVPVN
jgi:hypothetical protein